MTWACTVSTTRASSYNKILQKKLRCVRHIAFSFTSGNLLASFLVRITSLLFAAIEIGWDAKRSVQAKFTMHLHFFVS
jgi:hypothetical protein